MSLLLLLLLLLLDLLLLLLLLLLLMEFENDCQKKFWIILLRDQWRARILRRYKT